MAHDERSNALSVRFQATTLSITTVTIFFLLYSFMQDFCSMDKGPSLEVLSPELLQAYAVPPVQVQVGFSITDFSEFNINENKFTVTGTLWFLFDPHLISLDKIDKFSFERAILEKKSQPYTYVLEGKLLVRYIITLSFKSELYYTLFPFDDHKIFLSLINDAVSPKELVFVSSYNDFKMDPVSEQVGWRYYDHHVYAGYDTAHLGSSNTSRTVLYPKVVFEIDYAQASTRYIILIVLPLLLIFFIELFSFAIDQRSQRGALIGFSATDIAALFAYRFVIETMAPRVGYLMISDYLFFIFLGVSCMVLLIDGFGPVLSRKQKKIISIGLQLFVIGCFTYLLKLWSPC